MNNKQSIETKWYKISLLLYYKWTQVLYTYLWLYKFSFLFQIQLTRQDCEVNAPLSRNADLLQGPDLLKALEIGTIADVV